MHSQYDMLVWPLWAKGPWACTKRCKAVDSVAGEWKSGARLALEPFGLSPEYRKNRHDAWQTIEVGDTVVPHFQTSNSDGNFVACSQNQILVSTPTLLVKCSVRIHRHLKSDVWKRNRIHVYTHMLISKYCLFTYLCIYLFIYLFVYLFIYLFIYIQFYSLIILFIYSLVYLFIYLFYLYLVVYLFS